MPHRLKRPRQLTALIALVFWGLGFLVSRAAEEPGESSTLLIPGSIGVIVLVAINAILSITRAFRTSCARRRLSR